MLVYNYIIIYVCNIGYPLFGELDVCNMAVVGEKSTLIVGLVASREPS